MSDLLSELESAAKILGYDGCPVSMDAVRQASAEITRLRALVKAKDEALEVLADKSKWMLCGSDCPYGAHVGWKAYGRPDKIAQAALDKE